MLGLRQVKKALSSVQVSLGLRQASCHSLACLQCNTEPSTPANMVWMAYTQSGRLANRRIRSYSIKSSTGSVLADSSSTNEKQQGITEGIRLDEEQSVDNNMENPVG